MDIDWHIGDVIAKLRKRRRMNQTALAAKVGVNKATIVRAEDGDPKVSRETYIKIAKALGTELVDLEVEAARLESGSPDQIRYADVSESNTSSDASRGSLGKRDGHNIAAGPKAVSSATPAVSHDQTGSVPGASRPTDRRTRADIERLAREAERAGELAQSTRAARAVGEHAPAPRAPAASRRARARKHRR